MERPVPTGRRRHRIVTRWFGAPLLVLQIEETYWCTYSSGGIFDGEDCVCWRDATVEDMSVGEVGK